MGHETQFGEAPDSDEADLSASTSLMDPGWCGLRWTPWAALEDQAIRQIVPRKVAGVCWVRCQGEEPTQLTYIGQTGRELRERLRPWPPVSTLNAAPSMIRTPRRRTCGSCGVTTTLSLSFPAPRYKAIDRTMRNRGHAAVAASGRNRPFRRS